jgi:hypothetical protein
MPYCVINEGRDGVAFFTLQYFRKEDTNRLLTCIPFVQRISVRGPFQTTVPVTVTVAKFKYSCRYSNCIPVKIIIRSGLLLMLSSAFASYYLPQVDNSILFFHCQPLHSFEFPFFFKPTEHWAYSVGRSNSHRGSKRTISICG